MATYGDLAFTADPWINARAQEVLTRGGLPPLPPLPGEDEVRRFDPSLHPHSPLNGEFIGKGGGGSGGGGATGALKDALNLAERIDLDPNEKLLGSGKLDMRGGGIRVALTEADGARSLRIGIGGEGFGSHAHDVEPWSGNRGANAVEGVGGYTAKLDQSAAEELRTKITKSLGVGKKVQAELDAADRAGRPEPPRPAQGYWTIAEGSVKGEWADIAYNVYLDDPSIGVEVHIGAVPHGSGQSLDDLIGAEQAARLDPAEAAKFMRLLGKYVE